MDGPQQDKSDRIADSGFFIFRTPLLPVDGLLDWGSGVQSRQCWESGCESDVVDAAWRADVKVLRGRLLEVVERPEVAHALFVASPSLHTGIDHWKKDPDSKKGLQAERALVRYFTRMSARATPFGLFSGCSVGRVAAGDAIANLTLEGLARYRPSCRLDFDYLFALTTGLRRDPTIAQALRYWPNSSIHRVADVWQYVESRLAGLGRTHHVVKLEGDPYLDAVLDRSQNGATVSELVGSLLAQAGDCEVTEDDAAAYVAELIDNDVLVSNLAPPVTGRPPLDDLISQVESIPAAETVAESLRSARDKMAALDQKGLGASPEEYRIIGSGLESLPAKFDLARLFQIDMIKPVEDAVLTKPIIDELLQALEVLCRVGETEEPDILRLFREAFSARYDQSMVPILEALDEETGVGFGAPGGDSSPLLRGLHLAAATQ